MLDAITHIWLESMSRYNLSRSLRGRWVCALERVKMRMDAQ